MIRLSTLILNEKATTSQGYKLFCDLDGVLCDFNGRFKQLSGGLSFETYLQKYSAEEAWAIVNKEGISFWANLDWLPDGPKLWKAIKKFNPTILSAPSSHPSSTIGKKIWIKKKLGNYKYILVPAKEKQNYADKYNILIDDYIRNINQWKSRGGIAIHHENTNKTLKELNKYL